MENRRDYLSNIRADAIVLHVLYEDIVIGVTRRIRVAGCSGVAGAVTQVE